MKRSTEPKSAFMRAAKSADGPGADAIRVPLAAAKEVASGLPGGRPVLPTTATRRTADDEDDAQAVPETNKKPVFLMAGVAVALVAAGVGWFQFTSSPAPSGTTPVQAGVEGKSAKDQANAEAQPETKDSASKAVRDGVKSAAPAPAAPGTSATADAQKSREAAEQKKAEQEAQNRAAEKATADKLAADRAAADKVTAEKLASAKSATEKAAIIKQAADKAAADKLAADKVAGAKSAADKVAADRQAADKAASDKLAADKAAADKLAADKTAADRLAVDKAASDKAAADKAAADRAASAAVASAGSIADRIAAATSPAELYKRAVALRSEGKASQAVPLLRQASSQGHGPSSRLLAVIFKDGAPDVRADFRQAERFQALGESQGGQ